MVDQSNSLAALLAEFSPALVLLIGQHFTVIPGVVSLVVSEFTQQEAAAFFHRLLEQGAYPDEFQPDFRGIWSQIGGNPLALQLVVQNWRFYDRQNVALASVEQLFENLYSHLSERLKLNWVMFVLFPSTSVTEDVCLKLWPVQADHEAITTLRRWHMLESALDSPDTCFLSNAARLYIEEQYRTAHRTHQMIDELVDDLEAYLEDRPAAVYWPLEHLLLSEWYETNDRRERWVRALYREGVEQGRWAVWRRLLENTPSVTSDPDIGIIYSLCLRRLGEWASAQETLERIVAQTGRDGQFLAQARAMIELAILLRGRGEYEKAAALLSRSETTAARHHDDTMRNQVKMEQAQTALDVGDLRSAIRVLMALPASKRTLSLLGEVYLVGGELERSRTIIERDLNEYSHTPGEKARLFTLLGRAFEKQRNFQQAKTYFSSALTLLETQYEPFALARAQANMGALMIQEQSWEEAYQLLTQAETTQTRLNDRVALQMTQHNLHLVRAHFAG
jgi:tetratricopeptide (TPR) repeat protein